MTTTIVAVNPYSRKLERYDIGGLTPEELQALPLDERICEEISAAIAPCPPEEFLAAYVVGVVEAGQQIIGAWIANRMRDLFANVASGSSASSLMMRNRRGVAPAGPALATPREWNFTSAWTTRRHIGPLPDESGAVCVNHAFDEP
jgi:hypothetical protein